jgi:UPF0042 nucleotide-binding protein
MTAPLALEVVVVTGLSGAGRSTAAKCLEDLGWFVVDNLPPSLLSTMVDLGSRSQGAVSKIAVVADVRSRAFSSDLEAALTELDGRDASVRVIFLEASEEALVRRFESNRRPHPLQGDGRIVEGIEAERALLRDLRADADIVLDTSALNVHQLAAKVIQAFEQVSPGLHATVISFGYKYGLPLDADLVVDCRFLPNPHWVEELRPHTGQDADVRAYVLGQPAAGEFLERYEGIVRLLLEGYEREGKRYVLLAVGCTGGKHRSVAMTEELARRLAGPGLDVQIQHRDLGRE